MQERAIGRDLPARVLRQRSPRALMLPPTPVPAGLHIHLVPAGPTARFALWLEAYPDPLSSQRSLTQTSAMPHPGCATGAERPPWLPEGATRTTFAIDVP